MVYESENIEFRSQMTDDIYRKIGEDELQELLSGIPAPILWHAKCVTQD